MPYLEKISFFLNRLLVFVGGVFLVGMIVLTCGNIVSRMVWMPIRGTFELMGYAGAVVTAFALAHTQLKKGHICVDVLIGMFSARTPAHIGPGEPCRLPAFFRPCRLAGRRQGPHPLADRRSDGNPENCLLPVHLCGRLRLCGTVFGIVHRYAQNPDAGKGGRPLSLGLVGITGIVILLLILFFLGMPVGFAMGIVGFVGFCYVVSVKAGLNMVSSVLWETFAKYGLTVIPLFIFMGQVAFYSGVNEKLYNAAYKWVGQIRGGIAMATVMACAAFAAICGSNAATAATMTTVALPQMKKFNYNAMLSTGAIACGSTLGVVIPPSVVLIVIGLSTEQSIAKLFYGGIGAGIVLAVLLMLTVYVVCRIHPDWGPVGPASDWREKIRSLAGALEMVVLFLLVMIGLYFGFFTPTEAGAVGSMFAVLIGVLERSLSWKGFVASVTDTLRVSCMVIVIIAGAMIFGRFLAVTRIPFDIATWVVTLPVPQVFIMMIIFFIYIVGGAVMDALALLLITIPIFFPVAVELGYDPIWFGVTITVITTLGAVTPPVGATTYVVAGMARDIAIKDVFKGVTFFLPAYIICVLMLMLIPAIVLFLPGLLR